MGVEHVVALGETVRTIAMSYGITDWRAIYQHPRNAELRRARPDPSILHPGDRLWIDNPAAAVVVYAGVPVSCRTGRSHVFTSPPLVPLNLRLLDPNGEVIGEKRYEIVAGWYRHGGTSDADGNVSEQVPLDARRAELLVYLHDDEPDGEPGWRLTLDLNAAHPASTVEGVQSRLGNLGYYRGPVDGMVSDALRAAVRAFQRMRGMTESGEIDDELRRALQGLHSA